ncbi:MAG: hypothetical protein GY917_10040 [Planctomycetaceae bacterium]|nr:hypothetical protein [Planctomycetaceae bacterium]
MIIALVALRIGTGWHFFREGTTKLQQGDFSSAGFLWNARGPLAGFFRGLVWDADGRIRLGYDESKGTVGADPTVGRWNDYRARVVKRFNLDEKKTKAAEQAMKRRVEQLKWYLGQNREDILRYFQQLDRWQTQQQDASRRDVSTLREQSESLASELAGSRRGWLATIEQLEVDYQEDLAELAGSSRLLEMRYPGRRFYDSRSVDGVLPYFDLAIGICLVVGLFTSTAALAGAAFLLSVVLTQFPGAVGAAPVYYQGIEALGLCLLAALRAGQYAGLDFFTYCLWRRTKRAKQGATK